MTNSPVKLVLGSTSRYRRELLERLGVPFETASPNVEELQWPNESPLAHCRRLALEKAQAVAAQFPQAWVIGSDQVLDLDGEALSKPGDFDAALAQLKRCQGRTLICYTALALVAPNRSPMIDVVPTEISYRSLSDAELIAYLERETPYDSAGAVKVETAGIALLTAVKSDDPTAIIGLPLIRLVDFLRQAGAL
ncbi:MAG: septum formation protein Maf [Betaproteobacteria bacterium]|nr:MAG: septum formation protein Maf [Betaproteobacteria bacterium]